MPFFGFLVRPLHLLSILQGFSDLKRVPLHHIYITHEKNLIEHLCMHLGSHLPASPRTGHRHTSAGLHHNVKCQRTPQITGSQTQFALQHTGRSQLLTRLRPVSRRKRTHDFQYATKGQHPPALGSTYQHSFYIQWRNQPVFQASAILQS